jgi:regulatory protein
VINSKGSVLKARAYAFLLLKYRQRSVKEITDRLKKKKFSEEVIGETLDFLRSKKFVDDSAFSLAWIRERLARSIGPRRLERELKIKGIPEGLIEANLRQARESYSEEETARELAASRFKRLRDLDLRTAKRRVYAYLLRRGFSPDVVIETINQFE